MAFALFRRSTPPDADVQATTARLQAALRIAPVWVFEQDAELRYTWLQNAETSGDAGGATDADLMERPDEAQAVTRIKQRVLSSGTPETVELIAHVGNEPRRHRLHIEPLLDSAQRPRGVRGAILDIGPAVSEGASTLSLLRLVGLELRNAVNPIRMLVQLEKRRADKGSAPPSGLAQAYAGVERLTTMLEDLLDYARSTTEGVPSAVDTIDLERSLEVVAEKFGRLHPQAKARLLVAPPPPGTMVFANRDRLRQSLLAVLDRAARTTERDHRVTMAAVVHDGEVQIEVRSEGASLPTAPEGTHLDPIAWAEVCLAQERDEPPFALALADRLLRAMDGRLQVAPGPGGAGTQVDLWLRLASEGNPHGSGSVDIPPGPALRILVVDDAPGATKTLRLLLEGEGHTVHEAQTGEQCLAEVARTELDVVLLDIGLPDIGGLEVARRIRARGGHQPTLIGLTGRSTDDDRRASASAGLDQHLVKPVELAQLRMALARTKPRD